MRFITGIVGTPDDLMEIPLDRIGHYHIDDADRKNALTQTDPDRVMRDGQIDLRAEIKLLKEKGYPQPLVELSTKTGGLKTKETLKIGLERCALVVMIKFTKNPRDPCALRLISFNEPSIST